MPVFIEWRWEKSRQSLIAIFHFYDDFSKPNLRLMGSNKAIEPGICSKEELIMAERPWISWAPSHVDMALLMQMLCYANIINGLKTSEKKKLWFELEGKKHLRNKGLSEHELTSYAVPEEIIEQIGSDIKVMAFGTPEDEYLAHTCVQLCPEYLDYLWNLLKPYLRQS
jgi:hypothetical protein